MALTIKEIQKLKIGSEIFFFGNSSYVPMFGLVGNIRKTGDYKDPIMRYDVTWTNEVTSTETETSLSESCFTLVKDEKHKLVLKLTCLDT